MAYDQNLAARIESVFDPAPGWVAKKMFGGVGYLLNGNMACGILNEFLIVRVGAENYQAALDHPHTKPFDTTGRPMTGWVMIYPAGCATDADLRAWLQKGLDFTQTLPPK